MNDTNTNLTQQVLPDPGSGLDQQPPGTAFVYAAPGGGARSALSAGAGMVMLGMGIAQLLAPRQASRSAGVDTHPALVRAAGALAIASAAKTLQLGRPAPPGVLRIATLALELTLLARSAMHGSSKGRRSQLAMTGTALAAMALFELNDAKRQAPQTMGERSTASGALAVEKCITINKSPDECYRYWRSLDHLPEFMAHLESVEKITDTRSHWKLRAPIGASVEWDAEIDADVPGELLSWHSVGDADVDNGGTVRFERAPGGRGTIVRVEMQYRPPGGKAGALVARLLGESPSQQLDGDLRRFKQLIETGEITTTEGQSAGERSTLVKLIKKGVPG